MMMNYLKSRYKDNGLWIRLRKGTGARKQWRKLDFELVGEVQLESLNERAFIMSWSNPDP